MPNDDADEIARLEARIDQLERASGMEPAATSDSISAEAPEPVVAAAIRGKEATAGDRAAAARIVAARPDSELSVEDVLDSDDPEVRDKLRTVIAEEQEKLRDTRWTQRLERRKARTTERIREFADEHKLDAVQTEQLEELITKEVDVVGEIFRDARRDMNFEDAREMVGIVRGETDKEAEGILDGEALEAYQTMRAEEAERFGGGGGRGRGGRGRGDGPAR